MRKPGKMKKYTLHQNLKSVVNVCGRSLTVTNTVEISNPVTDQQTNLLAGVVAGDAYPYKKRFDIFKLSSFIYIFMLRGHLQKYAGRCCAGKCEKLRTWIR